MQGTAGRPVSVACGAPQRLLRVPQNLGAQARPACAGIMRHAWPADALFGSAPPSLWKCKGCILPPALCVCSALTRVALGSAGGAQLPPLRLAVYIHQKEHGRASNTGCLLAPALGARVYVAGIADDEAALAAALNPGDDSDGSAGVCAVLWPGEDSLTLDELRAATAPERWARGLTLVALDATWACARRLLHRLPDSAPRLCVDAAAFDPGRSLLYPARRYSGDAAERRCTYEACVAILDALGALKPGEREALLLNLKLKIDALMAHKNRSPVYGKDTAEALAAAREHVLRQIANE